MNRRFLTGCCLVFMLACLPSFALAISIPDEKKLAQQFMDMIHEENILMHDPVANHLITTVGNNILSTLPPQPFNFSFYLINDDTFNAFASPGSNIFIHRGLITALADIDEFAGIMAHEIAHAASRHVSQSIDRAKLVSIGSMAGMLAGILIGSSGSGDAGQALTIGSMAAGRSTMLAFTRENETEADQKAVGFLKQTCYSPAGLLSGLTKMRAADFQGVEGIPDYFKTHPGTGKRIAHVAGLLSDYARPAHQIACPKTYDFNMVKYRVMGLYGDVDKSFKKISALVEKEPENSSLNYCLGLLSARKHRRDEAVSYLQKALAQDMFNPMILLELGKIYIIDGKFERAINVLSGIKDDHVLGLWTRYYLAEAQLESGDIPQAKENLNLVIDQIPEAFARAYFHMANIMSREKNQTMSHYYLGIYYSKIKDMKNAARHLNKALETLADPELIEKAKKLLNKSSGSRQKS